MDSFPAFLPLSGARVVIAGEGAAADAKARLFQGSPAEVLRLSRPQALGASGYAGARLAFIADEGQGWAETAAQAARAAGALVNVVDRPDLSDFYTAAIVDRGAVVGAVGTSGLAPVLAAELRSELEARWPDELGRLAAFLAEAKRDVHERLPDARSRRAALRALLRGPARDAVLAGEPDRARAVLAETSAADPERRVLLLTVPRSADLLTLGALRALGDADRIVAVGPVSDEVLRYARRDAPVIHARAEEVRAVLAEPGRVVVISSVRLDPSVLADLGWEVERLWAPEP